MLCAAWILVVLTCSPQPRALEFCSARRVTDVHLQQRASKRRTCICAFLRSMWKRLLRARSAEEVQRVWHGEKVRGCLQRTGSSSVTPTIRQTRWRPYQRARVAAHRVQVLQYNASKWMDAFLYGQRTQTASVPFMVRRGPSCVPGRQLTRVSSLQVTHEMRGRLQELGHSDESIATMSPALAQLVLQRGAGPDGVGGIADELARTAAPAQHEPTSSGAAATGTALMPFDASDEAQRGRTGEAVPPPAALVEVPGEREGEFGEASRHRDRSS